MIPNVHTYGFVMGGKHDANSKINGKNDTY